jgi:hypothetical protein
VVRAGPSVRATESDEHHRLDRSGIRHGCRQDSVRLTDRHLRAPALCEQLLATTDQPGKGRSRLCRIQSRLNRPIHAGTGFDDSFAPANHHIAGGNLGGELGEIHDQILNDHGQSLTLANHLYNCPSDPGTTWRVFEMGSGSGPGEGAAGVTPGGVSAGDPTGHTAIAAQRMMASETSGWRS